VGDFIGRHDELVAFARILDREDSCRVINISGLGGVGKSTLAAEFVRMAISTGCTVGFVNARRLTDPLAGRLYHPVIEALVTLDDAFARQGTPLTQLTERLKRYKELHRALTEHFSPQQSVAVSSILQVGISAIRAGAAVFPIAKPLEAFLTPELASDVSKAIAAHRKPADRELLSAPVPYLSGYLIQSLTELSRRLRPVLVFDEFELIPTQIDAWLRDVLANSYGEVYPGLLLVLAGRDPLGQDWIARGDIGNPTEFRHMPLDRFNRTEVVQYVQTYMGDIDNVQAERIADSLSPAYRLPLVLRLLVAQPRSLIEISRTGTQLELGRLATELSDRLLDERRTTAYQRSATLALSVVRSFDQSIVTLVLQECKIPHPVEFFRWLEKQYFINPNAPAYSFYDLVRDVLRSKLRNDDSALPIRLHKKMLHYYENALKKTASGPRGSKFAIEAAYHRLSIAEGMLLPNALEMLFRALPNGYQYTPHWSRTFEQIAMERTDLNADDQKGLRRLATVLDASWGQSTPQTGTGFVFDPAMNVFFTSFHQGSAPDISTSNAELWLSYFECRVMSGLRFTTQLSRATTELLRIWSEAKELGDTGSDRLLGFCVAFDLSDAYNRGGNIASALLWSEQALRIAHLDQSPMREAFALVLMSANLKRRGSHRLALTNIDQAVNLVGHQRNPATSYYLGRFLLDKGVTHTYLGEALKAEQAFEASRVHFRDISPQSIAELSHRIGWLKRVRGDLDGALAEHDSAVRQFDDLESGLPLSQVVGASSLQYLRAKAVHSRGNVLREMCRHAEALRCFDASIEVFAREGGIRLEAIARKDRAWSFFQVQGSSIAERDLMRALGDLGESTADGQAGASANAHSATHRVEGWLDLSLIRVAAGDLTGAEQSIARAVKIVDADVDDPTLRARCELTQAIISAVQGHVDQIEGWLTHIEAHALSSEPQLWNLVAQCSLVRALVRERASDLPGVETHLTQARNLASRWNPYTLDAINELWANLSAPHVVPGSVSFGELLDIYDEHESLIGLASSKLAHKAGLWHRSFHAWIVGWSADNSKFVILQQRGRIKRDFPGYLDISAAGHYRAGEGIEGGLREFSEELGVYVRTEELLRIAQRTVNETLDNGVVNREFQEIYAVTRPAGLQQYRPGYPEVLGVFECDMAGLRSVLDGKTKSLQCFGLVASDSLGHEFEVATRTINIDDLIPSARHYLSVVLARLDDFMEQIPATLGLSEQLPDGSYWKAS
jgi:tetratricopeptide (TPR) repeat protein/isopentenyldiphosphate isomerase